MKIEIEKDTMLVSGVQELTMGTASQIRDRVRALFDKGLCNIDFRFDAMKRLDSRGVGALLSMKKLAGDRNGSLRIVSPTEAIMQLLELTQLKRVLTIIIS